VRRGDVAQVSSLCGGTAEAIEAVAHLNNGIDSVVGKKVEKIQFPPGIVMGALIRKGEVISIHHDSVFEENDHVVMFAMDKKLINNIEKIFQPLN
jgi:trk system potassium uptake protein TrkA